MKKKKIDQSINWHGARLKIEKKIQIQKKFKTLYSLSLFMELQLDIYQPFSFSCLFQSFIIHTFWVISSDFYSISLCLSSSMSNLLFKYNLTTFIVKYHTYTEKGVCQSVWVATTKILQTGGLYTTEMYFLTVLEAGSPVHRWLSFCCFLT